MGAWGDNGSNCLFVLSHLKILKMTVRYIDDGVL